MQRPDWWDRAACLGRIDLLNVFVPSYGLNDGTRRRLAVPPQCAELCNKCPVQDTCYETGFMDRYAVRGGTTPEQRRRRRQLNVRAG
jgi:hypothetical protein